MAENVLKNLQVVHAPGNDLSQKHTDHYSITFLSFAALANIWRTTDRFVFGLLKEKTLIELQHIRVTTYDTPPLVFTSCT